MKIAVIGGSGFVGSRFIEIVRCNHKVVNLDKQSSPFYNDITILGDIRDVEFLKSNLEGVDLVVLLAAEHRDDISPKSLYYDVNVQGTKNVLDAMDFNGINRIIFTSSVAVYGLNKNNPDENHEFDPFNDYGKSKLQAEIVLKNWFNLKKNVRSVTVIRPTVIFGERNRGNVFNLLKQISSGRFLMIGSGLNSKSMAYVGNVVHFIEFCISSSTLGFEVFNYVDKPDLNMRQLVSQVQSCLSKSIPSFRLPYWFGLVVGYFFDFLSFVLGKRFSISSVRVKKFCATTQYDSSKILSTGFFPKYSLVDGLERTLFFEFGKGKTDGITFESE